MTWRFAPVDRVAEPVLVGRARTDLSGGSRERSLTRLDQAARAERDVARRRQLVVDAAHLMAAGDAFRGEERDVVLAATTGRRKDVAALLALARTTRAGQAGARTRQEQPTRVRVAPGSRRVRRAARQRAARQAAASQSWEQLRAAVAAGADPQLVAARLAVHQAAFGGQEDGQDAAGR